MPLSGTGETPSEQLFVRPSPDAAEKNSSTRNVLTMPSGRTDDTDLELPSLRLIRFLKTRDPACLLMDRLTGKWAIKTSPRLKLDLQRPAEVVPHSSSTHEDFFNLDGDKEK